MLTKTTRVGMQSLLYLALNESSTPTAPRAIATALGCSPTYLAKVTAQLVRAGILEAHRGVKGGVTLRRAAHEITLLQIVEALQGPVLADYCTTSQPKPLLCQFHQAMLFLHEAMLEALTRRSLADIAEVPGSKAGHDNPGCLMHSVIAGLAPPTRKRSR